MRGSRLNGRGPRFFYKGVHMNRIKHAVILVFAFLMTTATASVADNSQFGVKGGVAMQKLGGDDVESDEVESRTGFVGGAYYQTDFSPNVGVRVELLYFMKGATGDSASVDVTFKFDYIELPVLLMANIPVGDTGRFSVFGGPTVGYNVAADLEASSGGLSLSGDLDDAIADFEFGLTFGAGLSFDVGSVIVGVDGRYGLGLTTVADDDFAEEFGVEDADVTNEGFAFMASIGFPIGSK
jgi:opacity protein-like surface antigen